MGIRAVGLTFGAVVLIAVGGVAMAVALAAPQANQAAPLEIPVSMNEYSISPRHMVVRANQPVAFVVTNTGVERHRFNAIGFGERWRVEDDQPGSTTIVNATFATPGVYTLYCSSVTEVRHRDYGSVGTLTVVGETEDSVLAAPLRIRDFQFQPVSVTAVAGQGTRFWLQNLGETAHALTIAGRGEQWASPSVEPGQIREWDVLLEAPGTYEIFCPLTSDGAAHRDLGLVGTLEVFPGGPPAMRSM